jgi:Putative capsular polysaccharide synthesis protein
MVTERGDSIDAPMILSVPRAFGRRVRRRSVIVDKTMTWAETAHVLVRRDPILIYSMGKTGTTSLAETLEAATSRPVVKAHALSPRGQARRLEKSRRLEIVDRPRFLWAAQWIRHDLRLRGRHRWDIICGVRDPVALAVSDHFYGLRLQAEIGVQTERHHDDVDRHAEAVAAGIDALFHQEDWFADELLAVTGIDVYATPFPHEQGYRIYEQGRFRVLLTRFEDLPEVGPGALQEFFGLSEPVPIPARNVGLTDGETVGDESLYRRFVTDGALSADVLAAAYDTRLARHLYSDVERAAFASRWSGAAV